MRNAKPLSAINVIPFIDVMLVLLAIVLTTATFVAQGRIPIDMPAARSAEPMPTDARRDITIDADGGLFFEGAAVTLERLRELCRPLAPNTSMLLRVDNRTQFAHFVSVIDLLKDLKLQDLSIVARRAQM